MGMLDDGRPVHMHGWESVSVVGLSVVAEGAALLTLGSSGPGASASRGWFPVIRGRRIPPTAVVVPAALGALALAAIWGYAFRDFGSLDGIEYTHEAWRVLLVACYAPLILWAPLLAAVTWAYWPAATAARRCSHDTQATPPPSDHRGMDDGPRDLYDTLDPDRGAELRRRNQARLAELEASSLERRARIAMLRALMAADAEVV